MKPRSHMPRSCRDSLPGLTVSRFGLGCVAVSSLAAALLLVAVDVVQAEEPTQTKPAVAEDSRDSEVTQRSAPTTEQLEFFEQRIRPLLIEHCVDCHGEDTQEHGLRIDTWDGIARGGKSGPLVMPGHPERSLLIVAVKYIDTDLRMPPDGRLSKADVDVLEEWIRQGAPHPGQLDAASRPQPRGSSLDLEAARQFWSFRPIERPTVPDAAVFDGLPSDVAQHWPRGDIDRFVLAKLSAAGVQPAATTDRLTLIRRATLDLTGLPPTPDEIDAFLADEAPGAFDRVIERLLDSPHYGEHWGRHWLDVARYADSNGQDENIAHGNAWRYRDYVVRAFNDDLPYDQFLTEQVAGDLLPVDESQPNWRELRNRRLVATGYLALGPKVLAEPDAMKMEMDIIDEQLDTLARSVLGLTFGCVRCHDHKFDPFTQADYYGLAGVLKSTRVMENFTKVARWHENQVASDDDLRRKAEHDQTVADQKQSIDQLLADAKQALLNAMPDAGESGKLPDDFEKLLPDETKQAIKAARDRLKELEKENGELLPTAMGASDGTATDLAIHLRGSHLTLGEVAVRGVPALFGADEDPAFPESSSGRLQLAEWLTNAKNPLTARVMANRIWRWHFGRGLVATPDNFGKLGSRPTHPELLDWLAAEFIDSGWSIKHLHRLILRSSAWQQSSFSANDSPGYAADPDNQLLWHFPLRRMEAESVRDSVLAVSGMLDRTMGGSLMAVANREWIFNHLSVDPTTYDSHRRSIYLPVVRNNLYDVFQLYDYSDASVINGDRSSSTVAPQALFMLNSGLVQDAARALANDVLSVAGLTDAERLTLLYRRVLGRTPSAAETDRMLQAIAGTPRDEAGSAAPGWVFVSHALLASNEFIYIR